MTEIFENLWDCPNCGTVGISAFRQKFCPQCGGSKVPPEEEYMGEKITNKEDLKTAGKTKDWVCSSCKSTNKQKDAKGQDIKFCGQCGNPKEGDDKVHKKISYGATPPRSKEEAVERSRPRPKARERKEDSSTSAPLYTSTPLYSPEQSRIQTSLNSFAEKTGVRIDVDTVKVGATITGVVLLLAILFFTIFHTKTVNGTVSAFSWSRDIPIERYQTVHHTHTSSYPADAYNVNSYQESHLEPVYKTVSHTDHKQCYNYTNNGDGTTSKDPYDCSTTTYEQVIDYYKTVTETFYDYDRDEWVYLRTEHAEGKDHEPYWPEVNLYLGGQTVIGAERKGIPYESYTVVFATYDNEEVRTDYSITPNLDEWSQYRMGDTYPLEVNIYGVVMNNPLQDRNILESAVSNAIHLLKFK